MIMRDAPDCSSWTQAIIIAKRMRRWASTWYSVETAAGRARLSLLNAPGILGYSSTRGIRQTNEDRYFAGVLHIPSLADPSVERQVIALGLFDGHGGEQCADFLRDKLADYVESADLGSGTAIGQEYRERYGGYWRPWQSTLLRYTRNLYRSQYDDFAIRLPLAFLRADLDACREEGSGGVGDTGSTCTAAYIYSTVPGCNWWEPDAVVNITVAQVGDSRALLVDNCGNVRALSTVHHLNSPLESERLRKYTSGIQTRYNAQVETLPGGPQVYMQFVNTRAFGDVVGKPQGISAEPDLAYYQVRGRGKSGRESTTGSSSRQLPGREAFLLLMTDGITDVVTDQEAADLVVQAAMSGGSLRGTPRDAAAELVSYAETVGSSDNCTSMVLRLGGWGDWSDWVDRSGAKREAKLRDGPRRRT